MRLESARFPQFRHYFFFVGPNVGTAINTVITYCFYLIVGGERGIRTLGLFIYFNKLNSQAVIVLPDFAATRSGAAPDYEQIPG